MRPTPRELLKTAHLPALLVSNLTNIRFLTGLSVSDGLLLALPNKYVLYVDPRYEEKAVSTVSADIEVRPLKNIGDDLQKLRRCGYEEHDVTVARMERWKKVFSKTKFSISSQVIEDFRRQKNPDELKLLRRAEKITQEMFLRVPTMLRGKITEKQLAWKLQQWGRELGADGMAFPPIVAFGAHTSRPHHEPTSRHLKKGDIVMVDAGADYRGYKGDKTRMFFTRAPTSEQANAYEAVVKAKKAAEKLVRAEVRANIIDAAARDVLKEYGMDAYFTHSLGHGVGLDIHEGISLSARDKRKLLSGEVVTVEPGVYFPGKFGIRVEDSLIVR